MKMTDALNVFFNNLRVGQTNTDFHVAFSHIQLPTHPQKLAHAVRETRGAIVKNSRSIERLEKVELQ